MNIGEHMKFNSKRALALVSVAALALVACGDDEKSSSGGDGGSDKCPNGLSGETISIVQNAWTASALEANILKILIEQELCVPAEIVEVDENSMFTGMADGSVDLAPEIWPSGIVADEQAFIDDGSVVNMGELGMTGQIGWFVPGLRARRAPRGRHLGRSEGPGDRQALRHRGDR